MTNGAEGGRVAGPLALAVVASACLALLSSTTSWAAESEVLAGGNARLFVFGSAEDTAGRRHAEQGALRLWVEQELWWRPEAEHPEHPENVEDPVSAHGIEVEPRWRARAELHGVVTAVSPPRVALAAGGLAAGGRGLGHRRFDLSTDLGGFDPARDEVRVTAEIDRANLRFDHRRFRFTIGRQPVTWGVSYFWPVLDLFGPFSPAAVDRDYKPGIDGARLEIPLGDFSEVEVLAAAQGEGASAARSDVGEGHWSTGVLARFHLRGTDVGVLLGEFYGDTVAGAFAAGDAAGFGLRAELQHTRGSALEPELGYERQAFWRGTLGVDRLLSPHSSLSIEHSWNAFGASSSGEYLAVALSDRVRRGEITSLAREYTGASFSRQLGPLWTVGASLLHNWTDGSTLAQPALTWSLSDNATAQAGAFVGFGGAGSSEYGGVPTTIWVAVKSYF